jgi:hypothetical protein
MPPTGWYVVWLLGFTLAGIVAGTVAAYAYCWKG